MTDYIWDHNVDKKEFKLEFNQEIESTINIEFEIKMD